MEELGHPAEYSLRDVFGNGDSFTAMMWGSLLSTLVALIMTQAQRLLSMDEAAHYWFEGVQSMLLPITILMMAFTAFATGSSWGVMGIMMPLAWAVLLHHGLAGDPEFMHLFYASVAAVLAGAVWGDHCSPLAETTLLAAMASGCGLVEHVRTQLPYALFVGVIATLFGIVPVAYGLPWWLGIAICALAMAMGLRVLGKRAEDSPADDTQDVSVTKAADVAS
ncbi:Na+/H+ antiporter NhaC family protein [Oceanisphaera arctica]|uniref:Na+/H+ antiporter NhaC family protein n=1 Tax=Oceanisphaera arctica TaxID=641510 RepID=UPI0019BD520E|nr:Na+/H+ antiporter NhaC family protein [Oceanisphaera arctica]GHA20269.1 hypothetical protein GCM10007082_21260 [Oceanisphaera arctica]